MRLWQRNVPEQLSCDQTPKATLPFLNISCPFHKVELMLWGRGTWGGSQPCLPRRGRALLACPCDPFLQ